MGPSRPDRRRAGRAVPRRRSPAPDPAPSRGLIAHVHARDGRGGTPSAPEARRTPCRAKPAAHARSAPPKGRGPLQAPNTRGPLHRRKATTTLASIRSDRRQSGSPTSSVLDCTCRVKPVAHARSAHYKGRGPLQALSATPGGGTEAELVPSGPRIDLVELELLVR